MYSRLRARSHAVFRPLLIIGAFCATFATPVVPPLNAQSTHSRTHSPNGTSVLSEPLGLAGPTDMVNALAVDSTNGYIYVGGNFSGVNDADTNHTTNHLARLNLDGSIDTTFTVQAGDDVRALLLTDDYLYVGGNFSSDGTEDSSDSAGPFTSSRLLRIVRSTGLIDRDWVPAGNSDVFAIARVTGTVNRIVVGMSGSGYLRAFNEDDASDVVTVSNFDANVKSFLVDGSTLYVGGAGFGTGGLPDRLRRYTYDGSSNFTFDTTWLPVANNTGIFDDDVLSMAIHGGYLYAGGEFDGGPTELEYLLRLPLANADGSGVEALFSPVGDGDDVHTIVINDDYLYIGGGFEHQGSRLARFDLRQNPPKLDLAWLPSVTNVQPNDTPVANSGGRDVNALAVLSDRVIVGGEFASINGLVTGGGLAAVDSAPLDMPPAPRILTPISGSGSGPYTINGTARAGSEVLVYSGSSVLGIVTADGSGNWSFTTSATLAAGSHRFTARARPVYELGTMMRSLSPASNAVEILVAASPAPNPASYARALTGTGTCEIVGCSGGSLSLASAGDGDLRNVFDIANTPLSPQNHVVFTTTGALPVNSASLVIRSLDIDWAENELDYVYLNGNQIGTLTGVNDKWSMTVLRIPDLSWIQDGPNVLQFRITSGGEQFQDHWVAKLSSVSLLIDGGQSEDVDLDTFTVPTPSAGSVVPRTSITPRTDGKFRVVTSLIDRDQQLTASEEYETDGVNGTPIVVTATLALPSGDIAGYSVRTEVLFLDPDVGTYVLLSTADYTFTSLTLTAPNGQVGTPITMRATVNPASNKGEPVTGDVEFYDGATLLGTAPVGEDGSAVFTFTPTASIDNLRARYPGNSRFGPSEATANSTVTGEAADVCTIVPDIAVSPAEIALAPGGSAQVTITIRNLCNDAPWRYSDLLLSLSDGLSVTEVPEGWLNFIQRAALQNLFLNPAETRSWTLTVSAAAELPTAPIFVVEHYFLGAAGQRIDGVFLPPAVAVPAPEAAAPEAAPAPAPAAEPAPLPAALPNTAGTTGSAQPLAAPLLVVLVAAVAALLITHRRRRLS